MMSCTIVYVDPAEALMVQEDYKPSKAVMVEHEWV